MKPRQRHVGLRWFRVVASAVLAFAAVAVSPAAHAFRTAGELPAYSETERVRWGVSAAPFALFERLPQGLSTPATTAAISDAFAAWSDLECSPVNLVFTGTTPVPASTGDGLNTVEFVFEGWDERGFPARAAGTTDVQYERRGEGPWEIVEADVYLNAQLFSWTLRPARADAGADAGISTAADVLGVMTHEAGHVIGLLHVCEQNGEDGAPSCNGASDLAERTMYPDYSTGQSSLAQDDVDGACYLYDRSGCAEADAGGTCGPVLPVPMGTCSTDAECDQGARCVQGRCVELAREGGDPCSADTQCTSKVCEPEGFCARFCGADADCLPEQTCELNAHSGACRGSGLPLGAACTSATDCLGEQCVSGAGRSALCTRACSDVASPCPGGWACESAGGLNGMADVPVCAPPQTIPAGGCVVAPAIPEAPFVGAWALFAGAAAAGARRRWRRARSRMTGRRMMGAW